jgi:hypothetical protein
MAFQLLMQIQPPTTHDNSMLAFYPTDIQLCFQSFVYGIKLPEHLISPLSFVERHTKLI